jgi:hypothetical protein
LIICPSCGSNFEGDLCVGCPSCGARAVGPPLAKAEHELRSYGRALGAAASGVLMFAAFLGSVIVTLAQYKLTLWTILLRSGTILTAAEVAAWRLKWLAIPSAIIALWSGRLLIRSIKNSSDRFGGLRLARAGFVVSATVTVLIATLIGITVPLRLERRQWSIDAGYYAQAYTIQRALLEYRDLHGTLPSALVDLKELSDPDGAIAAALSQLDPAGYKATALLASATKTKPRSIRVGAFRNSPASPADALLGNGLSFTNYDLRLPGEDKILGTDDDLIMRDGVVSRVSELSPVSSVTHPTRP